MTCITLSIQTIQLATSRATEFSNETVGNVAMCYVISVNIVIVGHLRSHLIVQHFRISIFDTRTKQIVPTCFTSYFEADAVL